MNGKPATAASNGNANFSLISKSPLELSAVAFCERQLNDPLQMPGKRTAQVRPPALRLSATKNVPDKKLRQDTAEEKRCTKFAMLDRLIRL
jgi:hypothetical protein